MDYEKMYTATEVAEKLGVTRKTVQNWIKDGNIPAYQFGSAYRVTESDLKQFIENSKVKGE